MKYLVYMITNLVNEKIYVGAHKTDKIDDGYLGSGPAIKNAVKKYGRANFRKDILFVFDNEADMYEVEGRIVDEEFVKRQDNYNCVPGGRGWSGIGRHVVDNKIGIHAWSFEQRSEFQRMNQAARDTEERLKMCSEGGIIGGRVSADRKSGVHGMSSDDRISNAKHANAILKSLGKGRFDLAVQSESGKRGGIKNKGFKWYNDGVNCFKYTSSQQTDLPFDEFIDRNEGFAPGRFKVAYAPRAKQKGKVSVTNGSNNRMFDSIESAIEFIESNSDYRLGRTNINKLQTIIEV